MENAKDSRSTSSGERVLIYCLTLSVKTKLGMGVEGTRKLGIATRWVFPGPWPGMSKTGKRKSKFPIRRLWVALKLGGQDLHLRCPTESNSIYYNI